MPLDKGCYTDPQRQGMSPVPAEGTAGQLLTKQSSADGDTAWTSIDTGGSTCWHIGHAAEMTDLEKWDSWRHFAVSMIEITATEASYVSTWSVFAGEAGELALLIMDGNNVVGVDHRTVAPGKNTFTWNTTSGHNIMGVGYNVALWMGDLNVAFERSANYVGIGAGPYFASEVVKWSEWDRSLLTVPVGGDTIDWDAFPVRYLADRGTEIAGGTAAWGTSAHTNAIREYALDVEICSIHDAASVSLYALSAPGVGGNTYDVFTSTSAGLVPAPGPSTSTFLRDDGVWAAPSGAVVLEYGHIYHRTYTGTTCLVTGEFVDMKVTNWVDGELNGMTRSQGSLVSPNGGVYMYTANLTIMYMTLGIVYTFGMSVNGADPASEQRHDFLERHHSSSDQTVPISFSGIIRLEAGQTANVKMTTAATAVGINHKQMDIVMVRVA